METKTSTAAVNPITDSSSQSKNETLGSLAIGDLIICHCAPTVAHVSVTLSLVQAAFTATAWGPIKFNRSIHAQAICTTPSPSEAVQQSIAGEAPTQKKSWYLSICPSGVTEISLLDQLGLEYFRRLALNKYKDSPEPPELLLIEMPSAIEETHKMQFGIVRLVEELSKIKAAVILIVSGVDSTWLSNAVCMTDMLFIEECQPDPDAVLAFKIRPKPFGALWLVNPDLFMTSLLRSPEQPRWRHERYLADDPFSRKLLRLRHSGMTFEEIGKELHLDKSTIKRRLDKLLS